MPGMATGYGVTLSKRQLDEVSLEPTPDRAVRKLMGVLFSKEKLARSGCYNANKTGEERSESLDDDVAADYISK